MWLLFQGGGDLIWEQSCYNDEEGGEEGRVRG